MSCAEHRLLKKPLNGFIVTDISLHAAIIIERANYTLYL